jgi:hypothetical protein
VRRAVKLRAPGSFTPPPGLDTVELCSVSHELPTDTCPTYTEYFKGGDVVPHERCPLHLGSLRERFGRAIGGLFDRVRRLFH